MSEQESFAIEPLDGDLHDRQSFACGIDALDRYLRTQATQEARRRISSCWVAALPSGRIVGYYTLAACGIALTDLPPDLAQKLPRYPLVPAVRLGRLAVDRAWQGRGLGAALLADALARAAQAEIAAYAMLVDAKDDAAAGFYRHYGFMALQDRPLTLFLPLATVKPLLP